MLLIDPALKHGSIGIMLLAQLIGIIWWASGVEHRIVSLESEHSKIELSLGKIFTTESILSVQQARQQQLLEDILKGIQKVDTKVESIPK